MHDSIKNPTSGRTSLWHLFSAFFRVGLFTFGGGYAMLPMLEREVIERHGWVSHPEVNDIYALAQSVPGVIAINTATFIGHRRAGLPGAVAATAGIMGPSVIIIILIALAFEHAMASSVVAHALTGVRAAVAGLIAAVALRIMRRTCRKPWDWALAALAGVLVLVPVINVALVILGAALTGLMLHLVRRRRAGTKPPAASATP
ncbi:MAG: chromate transporter [Kiritimatiellia bacterium]